MIPLHGLTLPQLKEWLAACGLSPHHAARVWRYLYRDAVEAISQMRDLPLRVRERLLQDAALTTGRVVRTSHSADEQTQKYLLAFDDERQIETVLMQYGARTTACVSSQVGCALGCIFCATGQMGFERNLTTAEIVFQVLNGARALRKSPRSSPESVRINNIVLMGMGEPLLNYDAVMRAVEILCEPSGLAVGAKQLTLSTVGIVPGIIRLADEARSISLAVSLHAATQDERAALVPAARAWPLPELMSACRYYAAKMGRRIFFEWTLMEGRNDSMEQAQELVRLLNGLPAQVNLIPLNPVSGVGTEPSDAERIHRFRSVLNDHGVPVSIRRRRGIDIDAGCGQLATIG